jgi:hypothetical protein
MIVDFVMVMLLGGGPLLVVEMAVRLMAARLMVAKEMLV